MRLTRGVASRIEPQDVEDLLDNKPMDCVHCKNPWPVRCGDQTPRRHYSVRIDPGLFQKIKYLKSSSTFLRALVEEAFGVCPLCGRVGIDENKD